jgi:hypothetical protein
MFVPATRNANSRSEEIIYEKEQSQFLVVNVRVVITYVTHLHLVPKLRMHGAISPLSYISA